MSDTPKSSPMQNSPEDSVGGVFPVADAGSDDVEVLAKANDATDMTEGKADSAEVSHAEETEQISDTLISSAATAELSDKPPLSEQAACAGQADLSGNLAAVDLTTQPLDADMLRHGPRAMVYVFSGPHLGAEISLPLGTFLVGSDASCDIILSGSSLAPRHASISIIMTGGIVRIDVKPLDGGVSLESAGANVVSLAEASDPPSSLSPCQPLAGEPWYLGLTCLVWNRPGVAQAMPQIMVGTASPAGSISQGNENDSAANAVGSGGVSTSEVSSENRSDAASPVAGQVRKLTLSDKNSGTLVFQAPSDASIKKKRTISRLAAAIFLFVFLGTLSVVVGPTRVSRDQYSEIVEKRIFEAGLPPLEVTNFGQGVEVRGEVKNDTERAILYSLAHDLHFPVYLDRITVQNDRINAVRAAFSARGFLPSIVMRDVLMPAMDSRMGNSIMTAPTDSSESFASKEERGKMTAGTSVMSQSQDASQSEPSNLRLGNGDLASVASDKGKSQTNKTPDSSGGAMGKTDSSEDKNMAGGTKLALAVSPSPSTHPFGFGTGKELGGTPPQAEMSASARAGSDAAAIGSTESTLDLLSPVQIMVISAYIKDALLEESMFAALQIDVPNLPLIKRHIVHQEALAEVLQPALDKAGLGFAEVRYLPNKVEISGEFDQDGLMRARMVLEETGKNLGIPVPSLIQVQVAQQDTSTSPASTAGKAPELASFMPLGDTSTRLEGDSKAEVTPNSGNASRVMLQPSTFGSVFGSGDVLGGLKVTGVTMTPLRFVTTSDGQRLFEGSELPSGYTLETISTSTLSLRKGGQMVSYPLRGSS